MKIRILIDILILLAVLFLPWWIYMPAIVVTVFLMPLYIEAVVFGFIIDVLYGVSTGSLWTRFPMGSSALILVLVLEPLRTHFRFNVQ